MNLECHRMRKLFSRHSDGRLLPEEESQLRGHLDGCEPCRRASAEYQETLASLNRAGPAPRAAGEANPSAESILVRIPGLLLRRSRRTSALMGAIGGTAAALIVSAIFFLFLSRSGEGPEWGGVEAFRLRREIEDHVERLDGVFRQILFSSGSHPERDLELARYELGSLDLSLESSRLARALQTASGDLGARGPDRLEARSVLLAAAQTLKELRVALDDSGAPSVRLEAIRNAIRRHRTLESIAILIHRLRGPEEAGPRLAGFRDADDFGAFVEARRLYLSGNYRESFKRFRDFLERYPRSEYREDSIYWMGNCAERLGEPEMAQEIYTAIADAPWFEKRTW